KKLTPAQEANRNLQSDVFLFIDILLDEEKTQVFTLKDKELVESIYGPVHARLLNQALALGTSQAETEKKPENPAPSS
ncbi:phage tail assembly chaperone, partial [Rouxiella badensis]|uniref:phage tail assembly chaperone n=1 Tax=Rouxiella badensis TaxID=1646377 RepID=UPI0028D29CCE